MTPKTQTLVSALRVLSVEIQSEDGVANAVVAEAADRLTLMANLVARHIEETKKDTQEMQTACETMNGATETIQRLKDRIKRLEAVTNDPHALWTNWLRGDVKLPVGIGDVRQYQERIKQLEEQLMDTKNKHAVLIADVVLNEDRAERIKRLEEENNELRAEEARLLNTNGELERRIKGLIDAGDAMFPWSERVGQEFWNQAKEAKP